MAKASVSVARRDEYRLHPVMIALEKARACWWLLDSLDAGDLNAMLIEGPTVITPEAKLAGEWLPYFVLAELKRSITEAEAEFRKSLTPEQAREQVIGGKAVAS